MSLYNALFGTNPFANALLMALGITASDVPRFRDCYLDDDGKIVIFTRTGGGNRILHSGAYGRPDLFGIIFGVIGFGPMHLNGICSAAEKCPRPIKHSGTHTGRTDIDTDNKVIHAAPPLYAYASYQAGQRRHIVENQGRFQIFETSAMSR